MMLLLLLNNTLITKTYMRDIRLLVRPYSVCLVCSDLFLLRIFVIDLSGNKVVPRAKICLDYHLLPTVTIRLNYLLPRAKIRLDYYLYHCYEILKH